MVFLLDNFCVAIHLGWLRSLAIRIVGGEEANSLTYDQGQALLSRSLF